MAPNPTQAASQEQLIAYMEQQIRALKARLEAGEQIIAVCQRGASVLKKSPEATLANIGEVVGALREGLLAILESNILANRLSLDEISQQCEQAEAAHKQQTAKVHLGGFVPRLR